VAVAVDAAAVVVVTQVAVSLNVVYRVVQAADHKVAVHQVEAVAVVEEDN